MWLNSLGICKIQIRLATGGRSFAQRHPEAHESPHISNWPNRKSSARAQSGANLIEQLAEASDVAGRAAEARVGVNLREFPDRGSEIRRIHCRGKLERRL